MKKYILCCDWGTSSFRLHLVDIETGKKHSGVISHAGIAETFNLWKSLGSGKGRLEFYQSKLKASITEISKQTDLVLDGLPVVISGMGSSSIGLLELPYASLPFDIDGEQTRVRWIDSNEKFPHDILLISGVQSTKDVMRGEETQFVGLSNIVKAVGSSSDILIILPGTHSKHIYIEYTKMVGFDTYITGELFDVLQKNSLLKETIEKPDCEPLAEDWKFFVDGVSESKSSRLLYSLFKVRTGQLLGERSKRQSYFYLSGLLIGSELNEISEQGRQEIFLCSGNGLFDFYKKAIEELGLDSRTSFISPEAMNEATLQGQIKIFKNNYNHAKSEA